MIRERDLPLEQGLDLLERSGRDLLSARVRQEAAAHALPAALIASAVVALVACLLVLAGSSPTILTTILAVLFVPMAVFAARYARLRRGARIDRKAALVLFDHGLRLKDRAAMADEFLRVEQRSGLHEAALDEAAPWLERARSETLSAPEPRLTIAAVLRQWWPLPLAAAFLLLLATAIGTGLASFPFGNDTQTTLGADPATDRTARVSRNDEEGSRSSTKADGGTSGAASPGSDMSARGTGAMRAGDPATASDGGAQRDGAGNDRPGTTGTRAGSATSSSAGQARAALNRNMQTPQSGANDNGARESRSGQTGAMRAGEASQGDGQSASQTRNSRQASTRGTPGRPPSSAGAAAARKAGTQRSGGEGRGQRGPGEQGNGQQSQPGQGQGQGQNGPPGGSDSGIKRSRGLSGLLLAVPMEDRLTGTANPGPVESMSRQAPPRSLASISTTAGSRSNGGGDSGPAAHEALSAQETRMLRNYFAAPGAPAEAARR